MITLATLSPQATDAPEHITTFHELAITYDHSVASLFNGLTPAERIFAYYLQRACMPGNRIATEQLHVHGRTVQTIFKALLAAEPVLTKLYRAKDTRITGVNIPHYFLQLKTFVVYLETNHGQYFLREHADEKRTPERLGLKLVTKDTTIALLQAINRHDLADQVIALAPVIFDRTYQPTGTIPNNIEQSARNFYAPGFTEADYQELSAEQRNKINAYFSASTTNGLRKIVMENCAVGNKYGPELTVSVFWLERALIHANNNSDLFDTQLRASLSHLIDYLKTGDEELFKKHSIAWLQAKSRIDYCFGFIETYDDPKNQRGSFQAEVTIKTFDLDRLNSLLPSLERQLPVDPAFKRDLDSSTSVPNASINTKLFGSGHLGPMKITAAYCLPNYEEIRSEYGSKQIIYPSDPSLGTMLSPHLSRRLFFLPEIADWLEEYDAQGKLFNDLWDIHCILHETIGHGSGKLATHMFTDNEPLTICHETYAVGQTIPVTSANLSELLQGCDATLEELRAEILALYVSIAHIDELVANGFLEHWYHQLGKRKLKEWLLFDMLKTGMNRMLQQPDSATQITGDHARANTIIMNYIIDRGGAKIVSKPVDIDGTSYTIVALKLLDFEKAFIAARDLLIEVQRIKSTGDGNAIRNMVDTLGAPIRNLEQFKQLKANEKTVIGDLKGIAHIYPDLQPVLDANGNVIDINATWPATIFQQIERLNALAMSTEL